MVAPDWGCPLLPSFEDGFREVFRQNEIGRAEHDGALDRVLEVPDVSGPVVRLETSERCAREAGHPAPGPFAVPGNEEARQQRDVLAAIP